MARPLRQKLKTNLWQKRSCHRDAATTTVRAASSQAVVARSAVWLSKALSTQSLGPARCEVMAVTSQTGPQGGRR